MASTLNLVSGRRSRPRGSVLTITAFSMVVLLSFTALAVDYGRLVVTRNQLQRSCDAAALAGASELPITDAYSTSKATYQAQVTAYNNNVMLTENTVSFPDKNRIQVFAKRSVSTLFARIMGIDSKAVVAQAVAGRSALKGIPGNIPLAITVDDYNKFVGGNSFTEVLINNNSMDFTPGTITAIDLRLDNSGKSGSVFQDDLSYGYSGTTVIGQPVNSALNADLSSENQKLESALAYRFDQASKAPWYDTGSNMIFPNYPPTDPRIVTIIVANPSPANNNNPRINIQFFAPVYLERISTNGKGGDTLRMRILPRKDFSSSDPRIVLNDDPNADNTIGVIRLLN